LLPEYAAPTSPPLASVIGEIKESVRIDKKSAIKLAKNIVVERFFIPKV